MTDTNRGALACFEDAIGLAGNHDNTGLDAELRTACDRFAELLAADEAYDAADTALDKQLHRAVDENDTEFDAMCKRLALALARRAAAIRACRGGP